ncbi:MAG: NAD(+) synthase [SAR324 cluster bacterium]|nr:NAD(+) synthase [SAR324 cluster bacterium]
MIRDCEKLVQTITTEIHNLADIAVIGMSGGADSSLTAILCARALGREAVYGISMPFNEIDIQTFNARSTNLAEKIAIQHLVRPVYAIADAINTQVHLKDPSELTATNKGNARSRARMCILYGVAHNLASQFPEKRVRVIGTGNLSEDFIGYDTKGGDALADFFPIGELFKSEVYQLLDYFRDQKIIEEIHIDRTPSAGLENNQTDEKDLGHTYNEMEKGIRFCLEHYDTMHEQPLDPVTSFVWQRHLAHKHKHEAPPALKLRTYCLAYEESSP